ncbi:Proline-rich nuclear receptor coactivator [Aspergillus parasiticus SU-1]|uniref:Proline-rich nuclear receptor coactivator n=1 Tax=Aspergillus parasiticus (strain ATCC 56775 / NRRL 5862 / SRRC 143 / SU-1) TaxID=1403190 RepID=A0A0F0I866_ASPPU|nr:Proline-rich nuclear receptor coactivator [Aspergillus parasiticus SU-1]
MSNLSPTPPTPKGPRNNRRNPKRNVTPTTQRATLLTTPPSSPPRNMSPGGTATDSSANLSKKKSGRSNKKPRDLSKASPTQRNGHRRTYSHSNNITTPQLKDSPHYAGPTFHASPAPSSLPIPSFFSKSVPDPDLAPAIEADGDKYDVGPEYEATPSKLRPRAQFQTEEPQSTPLDFLFKAAVEARNSQPQYSPEASIKIRSPQTDSKTLPQRKPNGSTEGSLPLGVDYPVPHKSQIGPSFATPYKDRMNALRSASSPSHSVVELDEDQRRAKTEALKDLLLNPRPQRPSYVSKSSSQANGVNEQPTPIGNVPHFAAVLRTASGPSATLYNNVLPGQNQLTVGNGWQSPFSNSYNINPQPSQGQTSTSNKGALSSIPGNTANVSGGKCSSPVYNQTKYDINSMQGPNYPPVHQSPTSRVSNTSTKALDTKKMEDDLRRILKLDVNPGLPSNGIQSSFA